MSGFIFNAIRNMYFADDTESHQRTERLGDRLSPGIGERISTGIGERVCSGIRRIVNSMLSTEIRKSDKVREEAVSRKLEYIHRKPDSAAATL